jgi:integrase
MNFLRAMKGIVLTQKSKSKRKNIPSNKGKIVGRKLPLTLRQIRSIRLRLNAAQQMRDLALFNVAVDSSLSACDVVQLRIKDIAKERHILSQATIIPLASRRPIQIELTDETRDSVSAWIEHGNLKSDGYLFPSRVTQSPHLSIRQYARIVASWVRSIGLDPSAYGTESIRRTKSAIIFQRTKDLATAQLLLGHTRLRSTARFLGVEVKE